MRVGRYTTSFSPPVSRRRRLFSLSEMNSVHDFEHQWQVLKCRLVHMCTQLKSACLLQYCTSCSFPSSALLTRLCSSSARWSLAPNFCSQVARKSYSFQRNQHTWYPGCQRGFFTVTSENKFFSGFSWSRLHCSIFAANNRKKNPLEPRVHTWHPGFHRFKTLLMSSLQSRS